MRAATRRTAWVVRAVALGATTLTLAAGAHTGAGGALPPPGLLALLVLFLAPVSLALARRSRGVVWTAAALLGEQVGLHTAFTVLAPDPSDCAATVTGVGHHAVHLTAHGCEMAAGMAGSQAMSSVSMLVAHAAATVLTAGILVHGERALRALLRHAAQWTLSRLGGRVFAPLSPRGRALLLALAPAALVGAVLQGDPGPRGPPAGWCPAAA